MFKKLKTKILEWLVKDLVKELPTIKDKAFDLIKDKKDEVLEKIKTAIKEAILKSL